MAELNPTTAKEDLERLALTRMWTQAPTRVAISAVSARSAQLALGVYEVTSSCDCTFLQGGSAVAALTTSHDLPAGAIREVHVTDIDANGYIAAITTSMAGSLCISRVA